MRSAVRLAARRRGSPLSLLGPLERRLVFVFGCPRSGTTFFAGVLGSLRGFVDLGEVLPLKASIPSLTSLPVEEAAVRLRRTLDLTRRLGLVGGKRGVEQTPETAFVLPAVRLAFPEATLLHLVRDGRDVAASLLERGWLSADRRGADDVGAAYGPHARFWVEPGREEEFAQASDARRAAWAWRRYVAAARSLGEVVHELRYERVVRDPAGTAAELSRVLGAPAEELASALGQGHTRSVGRFRSDLTAGELREIEAEAGCLLAELGYLEEDG